MPEKAKLSANRMRFDSQTGDFIAVGNVLIQVEGLTVNAEKGTGNVQRREIRFDDGIVASGDWLGDKINLKAGSVVLNFSGLPSCHITKGVKGNFGTLYFDSDRVMIKGQGGLGVEASSSQDRKTQIWLTEVRRLEDRSMGIAFGASTVEGTLQDGVLASMKANSKVWLEGRPVGDGVPVSIKSDSALYSDERGSVVLSGNVKAVQKGRTLTSSSIVYFPDQNRVEAIGGVTKKQKDVVSADRATITIDLSQERKPSKPDAPEDKQKKGGGK